MPRASSELQCYRTYVVLGPSPVSRWLLTVLAAKKAEVFVRGGKLPSASRTAAAAASLLHSSPLLVEWATVREGQNLLCRQMAVTSALCTAAIHEGALAMHNMNHLRERANAILQRVASGSSKDDSGPQ